MGSEEDSVMKEPSIGSRTLDTHEEKRLAVRHETEDPQKWFPAAIGLASHHHHPPPHLAVNHITENPPMWILVAGRWWWRAEMHEQGCTRKGRMERDEEARGRRCLPPAEISIEDGIHFQQALKVIAHSGDAFYTRKRRQIAFLRCVLGPPPTLLHLVLKRLHRSLSPPPTTNDAHDTVAGPNTTVAAFQLTPSSHVSFST
ncbi:hypothetical protein RHMOL_Rhmol06G0089000 [Rhododendron molle]|uniref:Uncharacterized protein n=1 Tax=Rhododendron molle TaxID=49168 RepID=A0ACC0NCM0_RHOML|nr:hypothetical protein RHMOL_Rhmol06G0089000 [Rhododendron molle]